MSDLSISPVEKAWELHEFLARVQTAAFDCRHAKANLILAKRCRAALRLCKLVESRSVAVVIDMTEEDD